MSIEKKCNLLRFNYWPGNTDGELFPERYEERIVGQKGVIYIAEHCAAGEGDKHYFDVEYENKIAERVFNPNQAFYQIIDNGDNLPY